MLTRTESHLGAAPGVEHDEIVKLQGETAPVTISCIDYCPTEVTFQAVYNLEDFLSRHRPAWSVVRWINVAGLSDMRSVHALATKYDLHPLAVEDILHLSQRAKVEPYGGEDSEVRARLFIVTHALKVAGDGLQSEQISIFLGHTTVLTFQETPSDVWEPIRQRLKSKGSRLRLNDASFLVYSLLDANVDRFFPILERYGDDAEELENRLIDRAE